MKLPLIRSILGWRIEKTHSLSDSVIISTWTMAQRDPRGIVKLTVGSPRDRIHVEIKEEQIPKGTLSRLFTLFLYSQLVTWLHNARWGFLNYASILYWIYMHLVNASNSCAVRELESLGFLPNLKLLLSSTLLSYNISTKFSGILVWWCHSMT